MFRLIKKEDYEVLANSNFAKNAMFYKDMLAFYNAFEEMCEHKEYLPNFCFLHTKELCLEGMCLLMRMYATEFKFETIKLSLEYLKILYYAIASYSEDGETVDKEKITKEFYDYQNASIDYCNQHKDEVLTDEAAYAKKKKQHDEMTKVYTKKHIAGNLFNALHIIMFVMAFVSLAFPAMCAIYGDFSKGFLWGTSVGLLVVGLSVSYLFRFLSKKKYSEENDLSYEAQVFKKGMDADYESLRSVKDQYNRVLCEKYEYSMYFIELFSHYGECLEVKDVLLKSRAYKLLTYNVVHDVKNLFISQQEEIDEIVADIDAVSPGGAYQKEFADVYERIKKQDWLYYNAQVRLHFIKKFADISEKNHFWKFVFNDEEIDPFGVDVRALSRENIAYLKTTDRRFVTSKLIEFMQTSYAKNLKDLEFSGTYNAESLKNLKSNYLRNFYNYNELKEKSGGSFVLSAEDIAEAERIPTYISMKLRLIENAVGLGNSDARVIRQMAESMFGGEIDDEAAPSEKFSVVDIEYPKTDCDSYEDMGDKIVYNINGKKVVGYKV